MKPVSLNARISQSAVSAYSVKTTSCLPEPGLIPFSAKRSIIGSHLETFNSSNASRAGSSSGSNSASTSLIACFSALASTDAAPTTCSSLASSSSSVSPPDSASEMSPVPILSERRRRVSASAYSDDAAPLAIDHCSESAPLHREVRQN